MAFFVVTDDLIGTAVIEDRQFVEAFDNLVDAALEGVIAFFAGRLAALALDLFAQGVGDRLGDALLAPARQFAGELFGSGFLMLSAMACSQKYEKVTSSLLL